MNIAPSDFTRLDGAASLSKPGFDILLALCGTRQAMLPTVRMLRARAARARRAERVNALCHIFSGSGPVARDSEGFPARFLDLSDRENGLPETVNNAFTRGFQSMLNPLHIDVRSSATPTPHDDMME